MVSARDKTEFLATAREAALRAGELILNSLSKIRKVEYKSAIDLVTSVDRASEQIIVSLLHERFPEHSIVAEEATDISSPQSGCRWIVDPLDGTTNFVHSFPHFAVSIALEQDGAVVAGLVYDPAKNEVFSAIEGGGAYLNGRSIHCSSVDRLDRALLATGFPYDRRERADYYLGLFKGLLCVSQGIRRGGSAALDLSYVAAGRLDGFWEAKLHAWDVAAGSLIAREAGATVTNFAGKSLDIWGEEILCSNGLIHEEMTAKLSEFGLRSEQRGSQSA